MTKVTDFCRISSPGSLSAYSLFILPTLFLWLHLHLPLAGPTHSDLFLSLASACAVPSAWHVLPPLLSPRLIFL